MKKIKTDNELDILTEKKKFEEKDEQIEVEGEFVEEQLDEEKSLIPKNCFLTKEPQNGEDGPILR
jgi:hypothetical protein